MIVTADKFVEQLRRSRVISPAVIDDFLKSAPATPSSVELATEAVKNGVLTRFQAEEILHRRGRQLRVGKYVLLDILGYGGMGTVYIAKQIKGGERFAMKLLGEQFKHDRGIRARFRLEARSGMKLDHPRLIKTYDLGKIQELYGEVDYCLMELFEGVTLLEGISFSSGPLKWDSACDVISQAAEGLQYLHDRGMVHRDVKPDNILVNRLGEAKILDFGLTLAEQHDPELPHGEEFSLAMIFGQDCLGTADFIPPEQSLDSLKVDGRADIYSLGCTLYVALTAQRPFPKESRAETVRAHRTDPRPRVDERNPGIPKELADLIERMMAINPDDRPSSMNEVTELLQPFRRRRKWMFAFPQVIGRRRELKRAKLSKSQMGSLQAQRPTKLSAHLETDAPGTASSDEIPSL